MTITPTNRQTPAQPDLMAPPVPVPVPAPFVPPTHLEAPSDGPSPVTAYAVAYGGSATAYAVAPGAAALSEVGSMPPTAVPPAAGRRSRGPAAAAALAVAAVGCGALSLLFPSLVQVFQIAGSAASVAAAGVALSGLVGRRDGDR